MSVQEQINRLTDARADIRTAIESKGVTVAEDAKLDDMAAAIAAIEQGGGAESWDALAGKPFSTVGSGLTVEEGVLTAPASDYAENSPTAAGYIENRPFYESEAWEITWDGDTTGTTVVSDYLYHISDMVPPLDEVRSATVTMADGTSIIINNLWDAMAENEFITSEYVFCERFLLIRKPNTVIGDITFSEAGFYAPKDSSASRVAKIAFGGTVIMQEKFFPGKLNSENPTGTGSMSFGRKDDSTVGMESFALGHNVIASGIASHAEGTITKATGSNSHAEGHETVASGASSHAEGSQTAASGSCSHAEGSNSTASENSSHAEGYSVRASGAYSHAEGWKTTADGKSQHVQGRYNIQDSEGTYAHIVGNGGVDSENSAIIHNSNAHTLDWDGNAWFAGDVYVGSTGGTNRDDGSRKLITAEEAPVASVNGKSGAVELTAEDVGALPDTTEIPADVIMYAEQTLTEEQKQQARANIGAGTPQEYSSTEEIAVGTWIDGRTIYRRTFVWTVNPLPSTKWAYYQEDDLAALNIDQFVNLSGLAFCYSQSSTTSGSWQPIPRVCPDALADYSIGFGDLNAKSLGVLFGTKYTGATIYFTIEYVKAASATT